MKISCTKENLNQGLNITSHLLTKNVNLPILQNVLIKTESGLIKFTTTNLEIVVNCNIRGKIEEEGEFTVPSKLFYEYVSLLPNEVVHLNTNNEYISIECGSYKTKINGLPAADFPLVPKMAEEFSFQIPIIEFKLALSQVLFSIAINESRPELTGVLMKFFNLDSEKRLTLVSTDSYRLSEKTIPIIKGSNREFQIIIPAKTLSETNRILSIFRDDVDLPSFLNMNIRNNQVIFDYSNTEIISRTIDEQYPDYEQIIPKQFLTSICVDREDFIKAVKTASLFSKNGLFDITLEFNPEQNNFYINSMNILRGENRSVCQAEIIGLKNSVTLNYKYLIDGLQALQGEQVLFEMIDGSNPCLLSQKGKKEYRHILMPIKN